MVVTIFIINKVKKLVKKESLSFVQKEVFYLLLLFAGSLSNRLFYYQQFLFAKYIKIRKNILAALSEAFVEIEGSHYKHNQYLVLLLGNNADKLT